MIGPCGAAVSTCLVCSRSGFGIWILRLPGGLSPLLLMVVWTQQSPGQRRDFRMDQNGLERIGFTLRNSIFLMCLGNAQVYFQIALKSPILSAPMVTACCLAFPVIGVKYGKGLRNQWNAKTGKAFTTPVRPV